MNAQVSVRITRPTRPLRRPQVVRREPCFVVIGRQAGPAAAGGECSNTLRPAAPRRQTRYDAAAPLDGLGPRLRRAGALGRQVGTAHAAEPPRPSLIRTAQPRTSERRAATGQPAPSTAVGAKVAGVLHRRCRPRDSSRRLWAGCGQSGAGRAPGRQPLVVEGPAVSRSRTAPESACR